MDITIKKIHQQKKDGYKCSRLELIFEGKMVDSTLVNTIRRLCLETVPTYAFCKQSINIEKNDTIFDNDYMKLRLSQITYPNVKSKIYYLPEKYWKNNNIQDKHPDDKKKLEMHINVNNKSNINMNIFTNTPGVEFYEDNKKVDDLFDPKYPMLLIQLRPNEQFIARAIGILGVGLKSDIWGASANCYYEELNTNKYRFILESAGQIEERKIIIKSCQYIIKRLEYLKDIISDIIKEEINDNDNKVSKYIINLEDENHTVAYILNDYLQNHDKVLFSGVSKEFLLINTMTIKLITKSKPNPIVIESIDDIIKTFDYIHKLVKKFK